MTDSIVVPAGSVVAAEIDRKGMLTGNAQIVSATEGDKLYHAGTHTTFGTWEAYEGNLKAQQNLQVEEELLQQALTKFGTQLGVVKFFKNGFGFLLRTGVDDLFFHVTGFAWPEAWKEGVRFERRQRPLTHMNKPPSAGERIVFTSGLGPKGMQAVHWCLASDYLKAYQEYLAMPVPVMYRVLVQFDQSHIPGGSVGKPQVEWGGEEGKPLEDLCARYPRNKYDSLRYFGHDDFNKTATIQMRVGDKWVDVSEDPRPVVSDNVRRRTY